MPRRDLFVCHRRRVCWPQNRGHTTGPSTLLAFPHRRRYIFRRVKLSLFESCLLHTPFNGANINKVFFQVDWLFPLRRLDDACASGRRESSQFPLKDYDSALYRLFSASVFTIILSKHFVHVNNWWDNTWDQVKAVTLEAVHLLYQHFELGLLSVCDTNRQCHCVAICVSSGTGYPSQM